MDAARRHRVGYLLALLERTRQRDVERPHLAGRQQEVADALGISEKTVRRHWSFTRVWLFQKIKKNA